MCVNALRLFFVMTAYSLLNIKELRGFDYFILRNKTLLDNTFEWKGKIFML